ncbi:F-box-like domain-containing protein [Quillaja saponaria]|uniref:F-box-like domain-containing protein n=1 Tax=Quillaja saponaria TaxID=32244 RepID=A0AAD7Q358_QUISA|nr:F-box-like domain-containing protein [Quillaja saponaria]
MLKRKRTIEMQIVPFSPRKSSRNNILYLSEEIIFDILSRAPAEFVQNYARYVCMSWSTIPRNPDFVRAHLLHAKSGLYLQPGDEPFYAELFEMKEMDSKIVDTWWDLPGKILDSYDGILLFCKKDGPASILCLANPVTRRGMKLPPIPEPCHHFDIIAKLARINDGKFRVIFPDQGQLFWHEWYILTVDSQMSWRKISSPYLESTDKDPLKSICIEGISYWGNIFGYDDPHFLAIDLNDETSCLLQLPCEVIDNRGLVLTWEFAKMGKHLCCIYWWHSAFNPRKIVQRERPGEIKIWKLMDLHQNVWVMTYNTDLFHASIIRNELSSYMTYWDDQKSLIFEVRRGGNNEAVVFNTTTGKTTLIGIVNLRIRYGIHTNSLVSL